MRFRVLGPLEVRTQEGEAVRLNAAKPRTVLALLLLHPNHTVAVDELSAALWPRRAPASAPGVVRTYISGLRRSLHLERPDGLPRLVAHAGGYRLELDPADLDSLVFQELTDRGVRALREGDPSGAAALLDDALRLWRGAPLPDVAVDGTAQHVLTELGELRVSAQEALIDARLTLGPGADLVARLRTLSEEHPLREHVHGQLMLALYRAGRQAEALEVFHGLRRRTADELGVEPGPVVQRLLHQILNGDAALDPPPAPRPRVTAADRPAAVPRLLPPAVPDFAGRATELAALDALLDRPGPAPGAVAISAIEGTAGVGKTTLAVRWAHGVASRFPDGQLYVNLRGFDPSGPPVGAAEAVRGFLDALGVPPERIPAGTAAQADLYRSLLADRRMLVVLDNAGDLTQVTRLLPGGPGCVVLVTSRRRLTGLLVTGARPLVLDVLSVAEARQLLAGRLGRQRLAAEPDAVETIIARCARLPLALAIVAARAAAHPGSRLRALAAELDDTRRELDALDGGDAGSDVRTALSWSHRRLPAPQARLFRLLSLHPGPDISVPAAASLAALPYAEAAAALAGLARGHLAEERAPGRYGQHDLLRAYAAERARSDEDAATRQVALHRMFDHYLHTAHAANAWLTDRRGPLALPAVSVGVHAEPVPDLAAALAWLTAEHPILVAMVRHAADTGFDTHAWQLAHALPTYLHRRGHWQDWITTHQVALEAARRLPDRLAQAHIQRGLAGAHAQLGEHDAAHGHLRSALDLFDRAGDRAAQARAHYDLTWLFTVQDRYREALFHARRHLELSEETGDRAAQATALNNIGYSQTRLGDHERAVDSCRRALALHREQDQLGRASTGHSLAYALHHLGRHTEAVARYHEAADRYAALGDLYHHAMTLTDLADCLHDAGRPQAALRSRQQALRILDELDHPEAAHIRALIQRAERHTDDR